jgi:hypothetical protein
MNVQQTNEIRELTTAELERVFGGATITQDNTWPTSVQLFVAGTIGTVVGIIAGWIAGLFD